MVIISGEMVVEEAIRLDKTFPDLPPKQWNRRYMEAEANILEGLARSRRAFMRRQDILETRTRFCALLRNPSEWPKKFVWDFRAPDNCAMGLARKTGFFEVTSTENLQKTFGLTDQETKYVFVHPRGDVNESGAWDSRCTPEDVALVLERVG